MTTIVILKFKDTVQGTVVDAKGVSRVVTFKKEEKYGVDILDSRGRRADFRFVEVPEGSQVVAGETGKDIDTSVLGVNYGSYLERLHTLFSREHKLSKMAKAEEN